MPEEKTINLTIERLANTGEGIGHHDGRTVFIPYAFPGETVTAIIPGTNTKNVIFARLLKVQTPLPQRIGDKLPYPGCDWQNLPYTEQLRHKKILLTDALRYYGKLSENDIPLEDIVPAPEQWHYRNKVTLSCDSRGIGVYEPNSHTLIYDLKNPLIPGPIQDLCSMTAALILKLGIPLYDRKADKGHIRQLLFMYNEKNEVLLGIVTRTKELPKKEELISACAAWAIPGIKLIGIAQNINSIPRENALGSRTIQLFGATTIEEVVHGLRFTRGLTSFFQVNRGIAEKMHELLVQNVERAPADTLFDIYGGIGFLSIPLAGHFKDIYMIESSQEAVELCRKNCENNGIQNLHPVKDDAEHFLLENKRCPDVVLLDPPRSGCTKKMLEILMQMRPHQIVYISCFPVTVSRDLKILTEKNEYRISKIIPLDMFPQTPHMETMVFLEKGTSDGIQEKRK